LISPAADVFEIAPAKVLHGAVRLHGLASSPTPDIQVRVACALAGMANSARQNALTSANNTDDFIFGLPALNLYKLSRPPSDVTVIAPKLRAYNQASCQEVAP
jgi:hypothetical protein